MRVRFILQLVLPKMHQFSFRALIQSLTQSLLTLRSFLKSMNLEGKISGKSLMMVIYSNLVLKANSVHLICSYYAFSILRKSAFSTVMRSKSAFSTVMKTKPAFSTVMNRKFAFSTVMKSKPAFSTVMNSKSAFSTVMKSKSAFSTLICIQYSNEMLFSTVIPFMIQYNNEVTFSTVISVQ